MKAADFPTPGSAEFTVKGACEDCARMGWFTFENDTEIQRCDLCKVFIDDDHAAVYALTLAIYALKNPRPRNPKGRRFGMLLNALGVLAWQHTQEAHTGGDDDEVE